MTGWPDSKVRDNYHSYGFVFQFFKHELQGGILGMEGKDRDEGKVNSFVQYLKKKPQNSNNTQAIILN